MRRAVRKISGSGWCGTSADNELRNGANLSTNRRPEIDVLLTTHNHKPETWQLVTERVFDDGSSIVAWALAATWPLMEVVRMVLAGIWEKRTRRKARAEGIEEGEQRANKRWTEWNRRRAQAWEQGEPFDEPPPGSAPNNEA